MEEREKITVPAAARMLGVTSATVHRWRKLGELADAGQSTEKDANGRPLAVCVWADEVQTKKEWLDVNGRKPGPKDVRQIILPLPRELRGWLREQSLLRQMRIEDLVLMILEGVRKEFDRPD